MTIDVITIIAQYPMLRSVSQLTSSRLMMTAMAASSLPSLEAEEDWGEWRLALAAPWRICSDSDTAAATAPRPSPPREVVAAVGQVTGFLLQWR